MASSVLPSEQTPYSLLLTLLLRLDAISGTFLDNIHLLVGGHYTSMGEYVPLLSDTNRTRSSFQHPQTLRTRMTLSSRRGGFRVVRGSSMFQVRR
jgi:hypothetical protein